MGKKSLGSSIADNLDKNSPGFLRKWQGELILLVMLVAIAGIGYAFYKIGVSLNDAIQEKLGNNKRMSFTDKGVSIRVKQRNMEGTLDSAQRFALKAFNNVHAPETYHGRLRYKQKEDKRKVDRSTATAGANKGWA